MRQPSDLELLLRPMLEATPYELVWVEVSKGGVRTVVRVYIDGEDGINIDDIAKASKQISAFLDVEAPNLGNYVLEVSSPGLDRPLMRPEHFPKQIGEKIRVQLLIAKDGQKKFTGFLKSCLDDGIELIVEGDVIELSFDDIDKARVVPDIRIGSGQARQKDEH